MTASIQKPLLNAFLQNDLRGNGKQITDVVLSDASLADDMDGNAQAITDLGGLAIGYKTVKEICIGIRTSGKVGSGSWDDPYDGSTTVKLNALLAVWAAIPGTIIRFRDGEYTHIPFFEWYLRPGCQIHGAGRDATILKCDPEFGDRMQIYAGPEYTSPATSGGIHVDSAVRNSNIHISDLTIDCNYQNLNSPLAKASVSGIGLNGNDNLVERVRVKNIYGSIASQAEAFSIVLVGFSEDTLSYNNKVRDCIAESPRGTYDNGIAVAGTGGGFGRAVGSVIDGCVAKDFSDPSHGVGFGCAGGVVSNCHADACHTGIYFEIGENLAIINNTITNGYFAGIHLNPTPRAIENAIISGNNIELRDDAPTYVAGILLSFAGDPEYRVKNPHVLANTFTYKVTGNTPTTEYAYGIASATTDTSNPDLFGLSGSYIDNKLGAEFTLNPVPDDSFVWGNRRIVTNEIVTGLLDSISIESSAPTIGALEHKSDITDAEGRTSYFITPAESHVVVTGDKLIFDQMAAIENPDCTPLVQLRFTDASVLSGEPDQNGFAINDASGPVGDVSDRIRGKFYHREVSLDDYVGKTVLQWLNSNYSELTGTFRHFYRNVCIIDEDGVSQLSIYQDYDAATLTTGEDHAPIDAENASFGIVATPLDYTIPTSDPAVVGEIWNDGGTLKASVGP